MARGYIHLWRQTLDSAVFQDAELFRLFTWILLRAAFAEQHISLKIGRGSTLVTLQPGQAIVGRNAGAESLGWAPSTFRDRLARLEKLEVISCEPDNHFTVVSVVNWEEFQSVEGDEATSKRQASDTQTTSKRQANDRQTTQYKNSKNANNSNNSSPHVAGVFDSWNARAECTTGLPAARKLTASRAAKIKTRLSDPGWIHDYSDALQRLPLPSGPGKNWQPDFDWIIANSENAIKVLEGKYDWRANHTAQTANISSRPKPSVQVPDIEVLP